MIMSKTLIQTIFLSIQPISIQIINSVINRKQNSLIRKILTLWTLNALKIWISKIFIKIIGNPSWQLTKPKNLTPLSLKAKVFNIMALLSLIIYKETIMKSKNKTKKIKNTFLRHLNQKATKRIINSLLFNKNKNWALQLLEITKINMIKSKSSSLISNKITTWNFKIQLIILILSKKLMMMQYLICLLIQVPSTNRTCKIFCQIKSKKLLLK